LRHLRAGVAYGGDIGFGPFDQPRPDVAATKEALFGAPHQLAWLIGRPTTPFAATIAAMLKA
jgi:hypothetical protein